MIFKKLLWGSSILVSDGLGYQNYEKKKISLTSLQSRKFFFFVAFFIVFIQYKT